MSEGTMEAPLLLLPLDQDETQATLDEALAFIDAWDSDETLSSLSCSTNANDSSYGSSSASPGSVSSSPSASSSSSPSQDASSLRFRIVLPPPTAAPVGQTTAVPRTVSDRDAKAAARKRKSRAQTKSELLALRDQAAGLETQLLLLQERSRDNIGRSPEMLSSREEREGSSSVNTSTLANSASAAVGDSWKKSAALELERVQRALQRNRELKDALTKQQHISRALRKLVHSKRVQHGSSIAMEKPSDPATPRSLPSYADNWTLVFAELYSNVKSLHLEMRSVSEHIASTCGISGVHLSSGITTTTADTMKLQISTSTPIAHNFRQLGRLFWSQMATPNDCVGTGHYFTHGQSTGPGMYEKVYNMSLPSPRGELNFRGATVLRVLEDEPHRVVIKYTSIFAENNSTTVFRENAWFIVTDLSSSSLNSSSSPRSIFQTSYCLATDLKALEYAQVRTMQQFVLKSICVTMRSHLQYLQNMVLADAETAPLLALTNSVNLCLSVECAT